jgi:hypothetical protein
VVLFGIYLGAAFVSKEPERLIQPDTDCNRAGMYGQSGKMTADPDLGVFCPWWDFKKTDSWQGRLIGLTNNNKYLLIEIVPHFRPDFAWEPTRDHIRSMDRDTSGRLVEPKVRNDDDSKLSKNIELFMAYKILDPGNKIHKEFLGGEKQWSLDCDLKAKKCKKFKLFWKPSLWSYAKGEKYEFSIEFGGPTPELRKMLETWFLDFEVLATTADEGFSMFMVRTKYMFLIASCMTLMVYSRE